MRHAENQQINVKSSPLIKVHTSGYKCYIVDYQLFKLLHEVLQSGSQVLHY